MAAQQITFAGAPAVKVEIMMSGNEDIGVSVNPSATAMNEGGGGSSAEYVCHLRDFILQGGDGEEAVVKTECRSPDQMDPNELQDVKPTPPVIHQAPTLQWAIPGPSPPVIHQATILQWAIPGPSQSVIHQAPTLQWAIPGPSRAQHIAPAPVPRFFNWPPTNRTVSVSAPAPAPAPLLPPPPPPVLDPAPPLQQQQQQAQPSLNSRNVPACRQFWKAGDYEPSPGIEPLRSHGMAHVRVHPKFLHSNATSHKWVLGAVAELLDNAMDEVTNGATFVSVDMHPNPKDNAPMLYVEDNGGGMTPERMRECMSLGFSTKTKGGNTIGQYGNGFKTSTMRLGADVIVFSRSPATAQQRATQSIGLLSFTFLRNMGLQDIIVPMVDYEFRGGMVCPLIRTTPDDWSKNLKIITDWSPYSSEGELFTQFSSMTKKGTRVIVYNLWEDELGNVELDFESDPYDVRLRSEKADPRTLAMAQRYTYSKHYLTYHHSLRSYAAILYFQHPPGFRIILRGQQVPHHNMAEDLMQPQHISYKPQGFESSGEVKMVANVVMGFVKDAFEHIDVQGFNVYHKNRLIKPFWKVWNTGGSDGRGIVGVLEANFVEPAHDKQSFERTAVLARLELRLQQMQKAYWTHRCHVVGYVNKKLHRRRRRRRSIGPRSAGRRAGRRGVPQLQPLQPRLSVRGFRVNRRAVAVANPPVADTGFKLVYRNRPAPNPACRQGFDLNFKAPADRGGPSYTPNGTTPQVQNFLWQGPEHGMQESPESTKNLDIRIEILKMMRNGAADPATLQRVLALVNGPGQPYNLEISAELEANKLLFARLQKLEQPNERSKLHSAIERNHKLEAQFSEWKEQDAAARRCIAQFAQERDTIRAAIAEKRRVHEHGCERMRNDIMAAFLRARELEAENYRLDQLQQ